MIKPNSQEGITLYMFRTISLLLTSPKKVRTGKGRYLLGISWRKDDGILLASLLDPTHTIPLIAYSSIPLLPPSRPDVAHVDARSVDRTKGQATTMVLLALCINKNPHAWLLPSR